MQRKIIGSTWNRSNRNGLNRNFEFLFEGVSRMNQLSDKADNTLKEAERINRINNDTNERLDNIIADSGTSSTEVVDARGEHTVLGGRLNGIDSQLAETVKKRDYDVRDYVISPAVFPSPDWTVNRDAFQAANDAAFANGGGRVVAPPGEYLVKGIIQDSNVEFNLPGVTFKNPDGTSPSVISARTHEVNGSVNKEVLTVDDTSHFSKGSSIIIHHAGGILDTQFSSLSSGINSTTTSISLAGTDNRFPRSGYMQVGNELISYTSMTGTTLNGVKRGQLGTSAQNHSAGDFIGVARHFYTEVTDIDGNDLILSEEVPLSVSNTLIKVGAINPAIRNLTIDGNKIPTGHSSSVYGIAWSTVRWGIIEDIVIKNGDMGGLIFSQGTTESIVNNITLIDCGMWESTAPKGAGMWLFHGASRNKIDNITVVGKGWVGLYIDDRTSVANPYDAPSNDNYITNFIFDLIRPAVGSPPGFSIVGSNRNKFINGFVRGTATGVEIDHGRQRFTDDDSLAPARDNEVAGVHFDVNQPWILRSTGNRIHDCTYSSRATSVPIVTEGNLAYAVTTTKGEPIEKLFEGVKFQNGTANSPGISFANEPNTGFYRDGSGVIRTSINGQLKYSFYRTEFRLADGINIATGTGSGTKIGFTPNQKIGFYGKTPMTQPPAISNKTGQTLEQVESELNLVKTTLRNLGLIAGSQ